MLRKITLAAALSAASLVAFVPAASAQTSLSFSFGTGGYAYGNGYDDDDYGAQSYDPYANYYSQPYSYYGYQQAPSYGYGYNGYRDRRWQDRQRREAIERLRQRAWQNYYYQGRQNEEDDDDG